MTWHFSFLAFQILCAVLLTVQLSFRVRNFSGSVYLGFYGPPVPRSLCHSKTRWVSSYSSLSRFSVPLALSICFFPFPFVYADDKQDQPFNGVQQLMRVPFILVLTIPYFRAILKSLFLNLEILPYLIYSVVFILPIFVIYRIIWFWDFLLHIYQTLHFFLYSYSYTALSFDLTTCILFDLIGLLKQPFFWIL